MFKVEQPGGKSPSQNLFVIIIDGLRWQEVFNGADRTLINDDKVCPDRTVRTLFDGEEKESRRKKLLPFFWNVIAANGQLLGDRQLKSKVNAANPHSISYTGYSELFTGKAGFLPMGNRKRYNKDTNVLEYLDEKTSLNKKIAVFASWNGIPYVLNRKRNGIFMDCGFEKSTSDKIILARNRVSTNDKKAGERSPDTRYDQITCEKAKDFIHSYHPRIVVIIFGEGDVQAHQRRYDLYLREANKTDNRIAGLWDFVQAHPVYKNNTNFLVTTDHGRGSSVKNWHDHGMFVKGSSETWLALLGTGVPSLNIRKEQLFNKDIPKMIASLV
jgi:hypothetical protein